MAVNIFKKIGLTCKKEIVFKDIHEIVYCEADSNYTIFHTIHGERIMTCKTLKEYESLLTSLGFFRIHHSILTNTALIKKYLPDEQAILMNDDSLLTISRRKKKEFLSMYFLL